MSEQERFYAVHVSKAGRKSLRWSEPFRSISQARAKLADKLKADEASMGFVVVAKGQNRHVIVSHTMPPAARKIVEHYEDLREAACKIVEHYEDLLDAINAYED